VNSLLKTVLVRVMGPNKKQVEAQKMKKVADMIR
jgi:hypothetical protein